MVSLSFLNVYITFLLLIQQIDSKTLDLDGYRIQFIISAASF